MANANRDLPTYLQSNQSLAYRCPAYAQLLREIPLCRKKRSYGEHAFVDTVANQCSDLPIESYGLHLRNTKAVGWRRLPNVWFQGLVHLPPLVGNGADLPEQITVPARASHD